MAVSLDLAGQTIAVDDDMPARFLLGLQEILPSAKFARASALLGAARLVKDSEEIAALSQAAEITDNAIAAAFEACSLGASELDVQMAIENAVYRQGAPLSFPPIVGAGENGAQPHHHTGTRKLRAGRCDRAGLRREGPWLLRRYHAHRSHRQRLR